MRTVKIADDEGGPVETPTVAGAWPDGFVDLYQSRWTSMVRLARLLTAADPAAEELVQEAFLRVRTRWEGVESPSSYLRAAVVNACRNHQRRQVIERRQSPPSEETHDEHFELRGALTALPMRQRSAVVLRYYEDLPETEIAELLDCSVTAVKSLLHRAVRDLRKVIER
ncbi:MAG TPA: sigma-70 family RNA polymerase sigma factor [Ilumatobacteraceae bacterium]